MCGATRERGQDLMLNSEPRAVTADPYDLARFVWRRSATTSRRCRKSESGPEAIALDV